MNGFRHTRPRGAADSPFGETRTSCFEGLLAARDGPVAHGIYLGNMDGGMRDPKKEKQNYIALTKKRKAPAGIGHEKWLLRDEGR